MFKYLEYDHFYVHILSIIHDLEKNKIVLTQHSRNRALMLREYKSDIILINNIMDHASWMGLMYCTLDASITHRISHSL